MKKEEKAAVDPAAALEENKNNGNENSVKDKEHRLEIRQELEKKELEKKELKNSEIASLAKKKKTKTKEMLRFSAVVFMAFLAAFAAVYYGSRPKTYDLKVSDISSYDIIAPRSVEDKEATEKRALEEMNNITTRVYRSDEISADCVNNIRLLNKIFKEKRNQLYYRPSERDQMAREEEESKTEKSDEAENTTEIEAEKELRKRKPTEQEAATITTAAVSEISQSFQINFEIKDARNILSMPDDRFENLCTMLEFTAENIMKEALDASGLTAAINAACEKNKETRQYYTEDVEMARKILFDFLRPNIKFNSEATENARKDAYDRVMNNPIMINRGSRIVSKGDVIDTGTYQILQALDLTDSGEFDWHGFVGQMGYILLLSVLGGLYILYRRPWELKNTRALVSFLLALFLPLIITAYLGRILPLASPVYFTAVILCVYFGFEIAIAVSLLLVLAILPIVNFNPSFFLVAATGVIVTALFSRGINRQDSFAKLILATTVANGATSLFFSAMQHEPWQATGIAVASAMISGAVSIIAAIGMMPIFELLQNSISPLKLADLAHPGHELMKRLFIEAPGTSQHSMMVANLADNAAEAIGANSMLCRVSAYYHDIGKLRNPLMFTENQGSENPHDNLSPEKSAEIIIRHTTDGAILGKKYKLPQPIIDIALEHHGTTVLQYFYFKACKEAEEAGLPKPSEDGFRYPGPKPSTRESGIVMLADSTEAAMKSTGTKDLLNAEKLMRKIFKIKNDQDQLVNSGLSYAEVEVILQSFLQVYAGQFHERIKYPDEKKSSN